MSHPVPPPPGPYGGSSDQNPQYGSPQQPPQSPQFGSQQPDQGGYGGSPAPQSPYGPGQNAGGSGMDYGQTPPPKKKWPLWVGLGCGCLLIIVIIAIVGIFGFGFLASGDEDPTDPTTTTQEETTPEESTEEETTEEETTEEVTTEEETTQEETTDEAGGDVSAADQDLAKERFVNFIGAIATGDYADACTYVISTSTGEPYNDAELAGCEAGLDSASQEDKDSFKTLEAIITVDSVETTVVDQDTLSLSVFGEDFPYTMVRSGDTWYVNLAP